MKFKLTFDEIYKSGSVPRFHGNGFVQIDLNKKERLNIWPDQKIHCQKVNTQIHNHRFSFHSRVIVGNGKLINKIFAPYFHPNGKMELYRAEKGAGENTVLKSSGRICDMIIQSESRIWNEYYFRIGDYHESLTEGMVMTIMEKLEVNEYLNPSVACKVGLSPDNIFDRHNTVNTDECWDLIREAFKEVNPHWVNPYK